MKSISGKWFASSFDGCGFEYQDWKNRIVHGKSVNVFRKIELPLCQNVAIITWINGYVYINMNQRVTFYKNKSFVFTMPDRLQWKTQISLHLDHFISPHYTSPSHPIHQATKKMQLKNIRNRPKSLLISANFPSPLKKRISLSPLLTCCRSRGTKGKFNRGAIFPRPYGISVQALIKGKKCARVCGRKQWRARKSDANIRARGFIPRVLTKKPEKEMGD